MRPLSNSLVQIAMDDLCCITTLLQIGANFLGHGHRAMPSSRAAQCDGEITLPFANVVRNQVSEEAFDAAQELPCLRKGFDIARHFRILAAEGTQPLHEMRIGQEANIKH